MQRVRDAAAKSARVTREHKERDDAIEQTRKMEMYSAQSTFSSYMARHNFLPVPGTGGNGIYQTCKAMGIRPAIPTWTQPEDLMQYTPSTTDPEMK